MEFYLHYGLEKRFQEQNLEEGIRLSTNIVLIESFQITFIVLCIVLIRNKPNGKKIHEIEILLHKS